MNVANRLAPDIALANLAYPEIPFVPMSSIYRFPYTTSYLCQAAVSTRLYDAPCVSHYQAVVHPRGSVSVKILKNLRRYIRLVEFVSDLGNIPNKFELVAAPEQPFLFPFNVFLVLLRRVKEVYCYSMDDSNAARIPLLPTMLFR